MPCTVSSPPGMHVHLVGLRGEVVLRLAETLAPGNDRLAGRLELLQRRGHLAQGRLPATAHLVEHEHHARDLRIARGLVEGRQDVPQPRLEPLLPECLGHRRLARADRVLLDQVALKVQHQRCVRLARARGLSDENQAISSTATITMNSTFSTSRRLKSSSRHTPTEEPAK